MNIEFDKGPKDKIKAIKKMKVTIIDLSIKNIEFEIKRHLSG